MARLRLVLLLALAAPAAACSVIVDGALHDSTPTSPCQGLDDGTPCDRAGIAAALICRGGICGNSRCGDGVLDARTEQCDDGDLLDGNGCETDCTVSPTCGGPGDCPDPGITCLEATCDGSSCGVGPSPDNTPCTTDGGASGVCFTGSCVGTTCGDGTLDTDEVCDDGNEVFGDGCYGCLPDCIDASTCFQDPCLGAQECQTSTADNGGLIGVCVATTSPVDCGNPDCSVCDPATGGCIPSFTADMDGDLHASISCGGDDCDDTNFEIYPGRVEECDPGMLDSNCDPSDEPTTNTWYADCDDDGYAPADAAVVTGCVAPTVTPTCRSWTSRVPAGTTSTDCHDGNPDVRPNQTLFFPTAYTTPSGGSSFDYNCNGTNNPEYADAADPTMVSCGGGITGCDARPPAALFQRGIACGTSATLYTCEDYRTACRRTASARPVLKRCR